jgi:hypothetical protein
VNVKLTAAKIKDENGNSNLDSNVITTTLDRTRPVASLSSTASETTSSKPILVNIEFSESVNGSEPGDL